MGINILVPMAGLGTRFSEAGYKDPKPLIDVNGKPMIQRVVESLDLDGNYIFIVQKEHSLKYNLLNLLPYIVPDCTVLEIDGITDGAARTSLVAKEYINNNDPLIIANSDQIVDWNSSLFTYLLNAGHVIALFESQESKWSYAEINDGKIFRVAEKEVISNNASVGIYGWAKGSDYVKYAEQMISKNIRTNNEFYICPVYNEAIKNNEIVLPFFVEEMHGIGTPEDLYKYLAKGRSN